MGQRRARCCRLRRDQGTDLRPRARFKWLASPTHPTSPARPRRFAGGRGHRRRRAGSRRGVQGSDLRVDTLAIGTLDLRSTVDEPMAAAKVDATLAASRIAGAADINRLNATANGARQALTISLQATGAQTAANATAEGRAVGRRSDHRSDALRRPLWRDTRGARRTDARSHRRAAHRHRADQPARRRGRLSVRGTLAPSGSDLQLEVAACRLSLIDAFAPGTNLDGTLQTKLRVQGSMDAPVVDGTYNVTGLRRAPARSGPGATVVGAGIGLADGPASQHRCAGERERHEPDAEGQGDAAAGRGAALRLGRPSAGPWSWRRSRRCWATTSAQRHRPAAAGRDGRDLRLARDRQRQHRLLQRRRRDARDRGCG